MSVDITGSLAGALVTVDPAALGSGTRAPAVRQGALTEASETGGQEFSFNQLFQLLSDHSSFNIDDLSVPHAGGAGSVQSPLHSALATFAPSAEPQLSAATEATWVPSDSAAWFALHAGHSVGGESVPASGNKLPQALAELGLADAPAGAAVPVLAEAGAAQPPVGPAGLPAASTPTTTLLAGNPQAGSAPVLLEGVKAMQPQNRLAERPAVLAAPRDSDNAAPVIARDPNGPPALAQAPGLVAAPTPVAVPEHMPANQDELAAKAFEPRLPSPASTPTALTNSSLPATMAAIESLPLPPMAGPSSLARNQWDQAFSQRVVFLAQNGVDGAQLRLDPPHLGTVHVKISQLDDQTQLLFQASHPQAREALEAALPKLRDMFAQQGLQLESAQVTDRDAGYRNADGGDADGRDQARSEERQRDVSAVEVPGGATQSAPRRESVRGLVDEFV